MRASACIIDAREVFLFLCGRCRKEAIRSLWVAGGRVGAVRVVLEGAGRGELMDFKFLNKGVTGVGCTRVNAVSETSRFV